jgi:hypothetical protein
MRLRTCLVALASALAAALAAPSARAQETGRWAVDTGSGKATASILSLNTLSTGSRVIDYHPILFVSCEAKRYPVWRHSVQIRETIPGEGTVDVTVRMDNGGAFSEQWMLAPRARSLFFDGDEGIARLTRARRISVTWRFGLFSGRGEAVFSVAGLKDTVAELAEACGVKAPGRS